VSRWSLANTAFGGLRPGQIERRWVGTTASRSKNSYRPGDELRVAGIHGVLKASHSGLLVVSCTVDIGVFQLLTRTMRVVCWKASLASPRLRQPRLRGLIPRTLAR